MFSLASNGSTASAEVIACTPVSLPRQVLLQRLGQIDLVIHDKMHQNCWVICRSPDSLHLKLSGTSYRFLESRRPCTARNQNPSGTGFAFDSPYHVKHKEISHVKIPKFDGYRQELQAMRYRLDEQDAGALGLKQMRRSITVPVYRFHGSVLPSQEAAKPETSGEGRTRWNQARSFARKLRRA